MDGVPQRYTLDGTEIKIPSNFDYEWYRITENGRLANGDMVMDHIAFKQKYNLSYTVLSHMELNKIRNVLFGSTKLFFTFQFVESNETVTKTVYAGALKYKRFRTGGVWYFTDVSVSLIER